MLNRKHTIHTVHHDLESYYWVLLWIVLRHTHHDYQVSPEESDPCARAYVFGNDKHAASMKLGWIQDPELHITFTGNKPLTDLMHQFRLLIWERGFVVPSSPERKYLTHAAVLELFNNALASKDWPDAKVDAAKPFVRAKPVPARLDQPKRQAEGNADELGQTSKRSQKQSKKGDGTATRDDPFESTPNPQARRGKGSGRGSRGRSGGGSKASGSRKQR